MYLGAEVILADTWDPDAVFSLLAEHGAVYFAGPPSFVQAIADAAYRAGHKLPRMRGIVTGATTVPAHLADEVRNKLGLTLETQWE
nr:hypothetical protein [Streptomyces sp. GbtcB6]